MSDQNKPVLAKPKNDIQALLTSDQFKEKIALALPKHMTPDRYLRVALNALLRTPKLMQCSSQSLMKALLDLSSFGLEPDGRRAHLIPFGQEVQLIIDYKGIVELIRRNGEVSYIHADVVREGDFFEYQQGTGAKLVHRRALGRDTGPVKLILCAYSFIRLKDGSEDFDVMTFHELEEVRKRSKTANNGPWVTDTAEMYKKTVFRRHSKWQSFSAELTRAIEYNDELPKQGVSTARPVFDAPKDDLSFLTSGSDEAEDQDSTRTKEEWMDLVGKFGKYHVEPSELLKSVGAASVEDLSLEDTMDLYKIWTVLESGEKKVEETFPKTKK